MQGCNSPLSVVWDGVEVGVNWGSAMEKLLLLSVSENDEHEREREKKRGRKGGREREGGGGYWEMEGNMLNIRRCEFKTFKIRKNKTFLTRYLH